MLSGMEYGLRLEARGPLSEDPRDAVGAEWRELLPAGRLTALYFGSEFCEDRLPEAPEAVEFCALAREAGAEPTLLTPVVTDQGLERAASLLAGIEERGWRPAVVFNDWGILQLLQGRFPTHPRRAGRLLNRSLRDPRSNGKASTGAIAPRGARLRRLLERSGVTAIETDADLEGGYLGDGGDGLQRTLHLPYTFATTGRNCLIKTAAASDEPVFTKSLGTECSQPCRRGPLEAEREDTALPLWRAGNTIFYEVPRDRAAAHLVSADRVVLHPRPAP